MSKLLKKLGVATLTLMLVFSLAACGGDSTGGGDVANNDQPAGQMSEEDYKAKVEEIYTSITTISQEEMSAVDPSDMDSTVTAMTSMIEKVRPLYAELGELQAPDSFKSSQEKIKSGTDASVALLDLSMEMFEMQSNPPDAETAAAKIKELTDKTAEFQTKAQDLTTGLSEVLETI